MQTRITIDGKESRGTARLEVKREKQSPAGSIEQSETVDPNYATGNPMTILPHVEKRFFFPFRITSHHPLPPSHHIQKLRRWLIRHDGAICGGRSGLSRTLKSLKGKGFSSQSTQVLKQLVTATGWPTIRFYHWCCVSPRLPSNSNPGTRPSLHVDRKRCPALNTPSVALQDLLELGGDTIEDCEECVANASISLCANLVEGMDDGTAAT